MKKTILSICIISIVLILISSKSTAKPDYERKTLIITVDKLDFEALEKMNREYSYGLISMKSGMGYNSSLESQYMTIATGRRVSIEKNSFKGIRKTGEKLQVVDYESIKEQLDRDYRGFSRKMDFLGESFSESGLKTAYIGDKSDILILADKSGQVDFGETEIQYDEKLLNQQIDDLLSKSDMLLLSYDIVDRPERIALIDRVIREREEDVIVIPRAISGDIDKKLNKTIAPIIYKYSDSKGIVSSDSTKRSGIVSNLDIITTLFNQYGIDFSSTLGNVVKVEDSDADSLNEVKRILEGFLNLNIIKYLFHGITILCQIPFILAFILKKKIDANYYGLYILPLAAVLISLLLGFTPLMRYLYLYIALVLALSIAAVKYIIRRNIDKRQAIIRMSIAANIIIIASLFLNKEIIYNSFIGYNNIVAAGRFYGLNNDIVGVFIATAAIAYFYMTRERKALSVYLGLAYLAVVVLSHTSGFGSNFGGLLTSVFLIVSVFYKEFFHSTTKRWKVVLLVALGIAIPIALIYFFGEDSHIRDFFIRVKEQGITEFLDMIYKKVKQLVYMAVLPQWGITAALQSVFLIRYIRERLEDPFVKSAYLLYLFTAVFMLLVNDTGVVAFVYMMTYIVSYSLSEIDENSYDR